MRSHGGQWSSHSIVGGLCGTPRTVWLCLWVGVYLQWDEHWVGGESTHLQGS